MFEEFCTHHPGENSAKLENTLECVYPLGATLHIQYIFALSNSINHHRINKIVKKINVRRVKNQNPQENRNIETEQNKVIKTRL